tara:strand:+ start:211 stop:2565 length:2355 start_codon:yes stop_codon:yes gene_type:complete
MKTFFVTILTAATFSTFALMAYGAQLDILEATHTDEISWIDIDGDNSADALTDGILILRSMFGIDSTALVSGALSTGATYSDPSDITYRISLLGDRLDIDGDGQIDALTDGLLILRYLFGLTGFSLTDSAITPCVVDCEDRRSSAEIESYLKALSTREPLKINAISDTMRININGLDVLTLETNRLTPLTYSIGGEDANYFLFNSSGKLTFKEPHNFKLKTSYKVTLNITDTADNSETGTVSNPITLFMVMRADPLYEGSEHWEPSRIGQCDYQKNISPSLKAITNSLGTGTQYRQIIEPLTIFDDETTTILVSGLDTNDNVVDLEVALIGGAGSFEDESGTNGFSLYAYDDGTHGDLFAGDKVWTRSCLSINKEVLETDPSLDPIITREVRVVRKEYRGTEPAPKIVNTSLSVNDTGFFYRNDQHFLINSEQSGWILADPARSDALKQIWDYKGSIFNIYALTSNNLGWSSGMWRIHDFLDGLGHSPGCDNVPGYSSGSHCYSFADGKDHPELMAGITIENKPNFSGFTHELEHVLIGFTMRGFPEENPLGICDQKADCLGTSLSRELTTDFAHIEAATTLISTLKGPPWNPTFGAPASVRIGSEEQSVDGTIIYDVNDKKFKLVNRDNHYIVSDFVLYHMGLIAKTDAMKDEYKIMNYSFPDCVTSSDENEKTLFCPDNYEFKYDEYIKFNVSDSIAKFGEYSNPRGLDVYDPANINVAIVHIGGRNHTDAEYTLLSKTYRSWARFDTSKVKLYFDRKKLDGDIPWSTSLGGLSRVNIDFSH